jgi:hypothetical protein
VSLNNRYLGMVRQVAGNQIFEDYSSYMVAFLISSSWLRPTAMWAC